MTSKIDICSNALQIIGDEPISAFDETESGGLAENLYEQFYQQLLSFHPWSFALKQQRLNLLTQKPDDLSNFRYAFQKPTDMIHIWNLKPYMNDYEIIGEYIYSNCRDILATYTYRVPESQLPADFVVAMQHKLASVFAMTIAENAGLAQTQENMHIMAINSAMAKDAQQRPQPGILDRPYVNVRPY